MDIEGWGSGWMISQLRMEPPTTAPLARERPGIERLVVFMLSVARVKGAPPPQARDMINRRA